MISDNNSTQILYINNNGMNYSTARDFYGYLKTNISHRGKTVYVIIESSSDREI
jgi:hypothetical protein